MTDARCKCSRCGGWMRRKPTKKTPKKRAKSPYASVCVECLPALKQERALWQRKWRKGGT